MFDYLLLLQFLLPGVRVLQVASISFFFCVARNAQVNIHYFPEEETETPRGGDLPTVAIQL